jgi:hypothetical protein
MSITMTKVWWTKYVWRHGEKDEGSTRAQVYSNNIFIWLAIISHDCVVSCTKMYTFVCKNNLIHTCAVWCIGMRFEWEKRYKDVVKNGWLLSVNCGENLYQFRVMERFLGVVGHDVPNLSVDYNYGQHVSILVRKLL